MMQRTLRILGIRGVPAAHGGFETFAEQLSIFLVSRGWRVVVYCQEDGEGESFTDFWQGVERVHFYVKQAGPAGTIAFDWLVTRHAAQHKDLCLTLGYNTAIFCGFLRLKGTPNIINMDGIEWSRAKWGKFAKSWFWMNDWAGCWLGNHLIADHPEIKAHLSSRVNPEKITTIAYGADPIGDVPETPVVNLGLVPGRYLTLIARPEPENSILEIVEGFSRKIRGIDLAVLGNYSEANPYHRAVRAAGSSEVKFLGAIYDKPVLHALRKYCAVYVHGHQVGGTNPSLVEALGAGNAVISHDNRFTRWVAGEGARYFDGADGFERVLEELLVDRQALERMRVESRVRFKNNFTWPQILGEYEGLLTQFLPARAPRPESAPVKDARRSSFGKTDSI